MKLVNLCLLFRLTADALYSQTPKKLQGSDFKTATYCQTCHAEIYAQWISSTHSQAFSDPIYQAFLRRVSEKTGGRSNQFCVSCHAPLATITKTNSIPKNLFDRGKEPPLLEDSVSCMFCHTISHLSKIALGELRLRGAPSQAKFELS